MDGRPADPEVGINDVLIRIHKTSICGTDVHIWNWDAWAQKTIPVDRLWENTRYFKDEMKRLGFDIGASVTPITPVMLGEAKLAQAFSRRLFEENVFAMAIGFPTVPQGKAHIRVMLSAALSRDDLDYGLERFAKIGKEFEIR